VPWADEFQHPTIRYARREKREKERERERERERETTEREIVWA
jgi:hypothetical protein